MKRVSTEYSEVDLATVTPHPDNPRQGDVGAIHESIEANGWYGVIVVQKATGHILAGNHRYQAALAAGAETLPAAVIDVDDDAARRILLADNRTNDLSSYDNYALAEVLQELAESDAQLAGTAWTGDDLDDLLAALEGPPEEEWAGAMGGLAGERQPYQQMTFTLHDDQVAAVKAAIKLAQERGHSNSDLNENRNGNALAAICEAYQ